MYKDMDNILFDLKFFLLHHYAKGTTKKKLLAFVMSLEKEKREIIKQEFKRDIDSMNRVLIKQCLIKYINQITSSIDKQKQKK